MPYSKYYNILGLPNNASNEEIRKKYRKLVMLYHPDKNPDLTAQAKFLEITQAYNILINKVEIPIQERKTEPTRHKRDQQQASNTKKSKEEILKAARFRFQEQQKQKALHNQRFYQNLTKGAKWNFFKISAFICFGFGILILVDTLLPHRFEKDLVTHYNSNDVIQTSGDKILIKTQNDHTYFVNVEKWEYKYLYTTGTTIFIEQSFILHQAYKIHSLTKTNYKTFRVEYSMGQLSLLFAIFFSIPFITYIFRRNSTLFVIMYKVCLYVINGAFVITLYTDKRYLHLVTLGFY
jgi:hypothetical protein